MKKSVIFALPLIAIVFAVACKKQEAAPAAEQPAAVQTETTTAAPAAAPAATPAPAAAPAKAPEKKGK